MKIIHEFLSFGPAAVKIRFLEVQIRNKENAIRATERFFRTQSARITDPGKRRKYLEIQNKKIQRERGRLEQDGIELDSLRKGSQGPGV